jgi:hypothetical protein
MYISCLDYFYTVFLYNNNETEGSMGIRKGMGYGYETEGIMGIRKGMGYGYETEGSMFMRVWWRGRGVWICIC